MSLGSGSPWRESTQIGFGRKRRSALGPGVRARVLALAERWEAQGRAADAEELRAAVRKGRA
jgi:hypothetical protein